MMDKQYEQFYVKQAGTGLAGFSGVRYQRGHGFFGRIFSGIIPAVLKFLGKEALSTGLDIASDVRNGKNLKAAAMSRVKETGARIADHAIERGREYVQTGKSYKRKRSQTKMTVDKEKSAKKKSRLSVKKFKYS